jgi:hypothetical protein
LVSITLVEEIFYDGDLSTNDARNGKSKSKLATSENLGVPPLKLMHW